MVTERGNFASLYPPVFYWMTSIFVSQDLELSTLLVRWFNALLFVGMLTITFLLLPVKRRSALLASATLAIVPLGMFIIPSTNPSSWAILSAATLWIIMLGYFESRGPRKWGLAASAVVATVIGAGARADAAIYAAVSIGVAGVLAFRADKRFWRDSILGSLPAGDSGCRFLLGCLPVRCNHGWSHRRTPHIGCPLDRAVLRQSR